MAERVGPLLAVLVANAADEDMWALAMTVDAERRRGNSVTALTRPRRPSKTSP